MDGDGVYSHSLQSKDRPCVGVLALQGGYDAHIQHLTQLKIPSKKVRSPEDLQGISGLVLPGGESSVMLKLIERSGLRKPLVDQINQKIPILATCAGVILLAKTVYTNSHRTQRQDSLGLLSVTVVRNGWGRQIKSGVQTVEIEETQDTSSSISEQRLKSPSCEMMFIRAPRLIAVDRQVSIYGRVSSEPVWVKQGHIHALCGHPELGNDPWIHRFVFKQLCPS